MDSCHLNLYIASNFMFTIFKANFVAQFYWLDKTLVTIESMRNTLVTVLLQKLNETQVWVPTRLFKRHHLPYEFQFIFNFKAARHI